MGDECATHHLFSSRSPTAAVKNLIATVSGDAAINRAVAALVLAFEADPVARWMYRTPDQYLLHIPRLFRALGAGSFETGAAYCAADGGGAAIWFPPNVHGDDAAVEAIIADSTSGVMQGDIAAVFEMTAHYRPSEPHWYLSLIGVETLHRNKGYGADLLEHVLHQCDGEHREAYLWSSNKKNISFYQRHGFKIVGEIQIGSSPPVFPMLRSSR
jgi:ribosomal protein S18 acetylase RimI-like enzyme